MKVTPTQNLLLEVLAARYRLGEHLWTFEARHAHQLEKLADLELVDVLSGVSEGTVRAMLTEKGREEVLSDSYTPPQRHEKEEFAVESRSHAGGPWDRIDTGQHGSSRHGRPYTRAEAEAEVRTAMKNLGWDTVRLVHRVVSDWVTIAPVTTPLAPDFFEGPLGTRTESSHAKPERPVPRLLTVGMLVDRIGHYKTNGRIVVVSDVRRPPILVRWPGLEDEWIEADMLAPHEEL